MIVERRYDEAISFCKLQLAAAPRCVTLRLSLARALLAGGSSSAARAQLEECLRIDPTLTAARAMLAEQGRSGSPSLRAVPPARTPPPAAPARTAATATTAAAALARTVAPARSAPAVRVTAEPAPTVDPPSAPAVEPARVAPPALSSPPVMVVWPPPSVSLFDEDADEPTNVLPEHRKVPSAVELELPASVAPPRLVSAAPEPLALFEPSRPLAVADDAAVAVANDHPVAVPRGRTRRRQAVRSPFADTPERSRASARWERPMSIEARRPQPLLRVALVGVVLIGLLSMWRLGRDGESTALPVAAVAASASRPAPEPSLVKAENRPYDVLGTDVWIHPLQGPARRMPIRDSRLFGAERLGDRPSECRGGHCGIDLAGEFGEPVYAVHEGVVERVQRDANASHGGHYVRLLHRGGTITTQYFHLSEIPRRLEEGVTIKAGEVVGYVGLSGVRRSEPHLHFTIAVQEPSGADGRYLDPEPLVALWPLRVSQKGDGLRVSNTAPGLARGFIRRRHRHRPLEVPVEDSESAAE